MRDVVLAPLDGESAGQWLADRTALVPHAGVAAALGVPFQSLAQHARATLAGQGEWRVASALDWQRHLLVLLADELPAGEVMPEARSLAPLLAGLLRGGADLTRLGTEAPPRVRRLARLAAALQASLRARGLLHPAELAWEAARSASLRPLPVLLTGYLGLDAGESTYLGAIAAPGSVICLPVPPEGPSAAQQRLMQRLRDDGWTVREAPPVFREAAGRRVNGYSFADEESEWRGVLGLVKQRLGAGVPAAGVAIVVRDPAAQAPLALAIAREFELPLRPTHRIPLSETWLGSWLLAWEEALRGGFRDRACAALWRHRLTERPPDAEVGASSDAAAPALPTDFCQAFTPPAGQSGVAWCDWFEAACQRLGLLQRVGEDPVSYVGLALLREDLRAWLRAETALSLRGFLEALNAVSSLLRVPAVPGEGGVALLSPGELVGVRFQEVYAVGLAEGHWPPPLRENPACDFHDGAAAAALGAEFPSPRDRLEREWAEFQAACAAATEALTLSHARGLAGRATLPSPYWAQRGITPEAAPAPLVLASRRMLRQHCLDALTPEQEPLAPRLQAALAIEAAREGAAPPGPYEGQTGRRWDPAAQMFSVTQLTALGQCPFRWFASHALKLVPRRVPEDELTPAERGNLYHLALFQAGQAALDQLDWRAGLGEALPAALEEAREALELPADARWERQRLEHLATLRRAIAADDFLSAGARPEALEDAFTTTWAGLRLTGRIDRIDRRADGTLELVDYKLGASPPAGVCDAHGRLGLDLQLPIYEQAAVQARGPDTLVAQTRYFSLKKARVLSSKRPEASDLEDFVARVRRTFESGTFAVQPDLRREACSRCDMRPVCRVGIGLERKRQAPADGTSEAPAP
ncbi:MAG: PD-(D/E)XK nuclease family protein [Candidatus Sericytochromatia bacterium]|nr:PD-(D/E)XK nuclease family protein [Candidatus Sericytochromatia bacterium]